MRIAARPLRPAALALPDALGARVPIVPTYLGDDGAGLRAALRDGADAIVFVALGAGHVAPPVLAALRAAAAAVPVALTLRPERGVLAHATYGFEGAEGDLRASGALPAAALSPQAARMVLLAGLAGGADRAARAARARRRSVSGWRADRRPWRSDLVRRPPDVYPPQAIGRIRSRKHPLPNRRE